MTVTRYSAAFLALSCACQAHAAMFHSQQILIAGSEAVNATGINDAGTIIGTTPSFGFVEQGSNLSILGSAYPAAINRDGAVTGSMGGQGFLWQNGAFVPGVGFALGLFNGLPLYPVLNRHTEIAYSSSNGSSQTAYAFTPGQHPHALKGVSQQSAIVASINDHGVIAGYERASINGQSYEVAFFGKHGLFNMLLSPQGQSTFGGLVNNSGQVAFTDGLTGYVYAAGVTSSFSLPTSSYNLLIQAINNKGRVVGSYTDDSQNPAVQHVFYYNGTTVSSFGAFATTDAVHAALNDRDVLVVSDMINGQQMTSYRVTCNGSAC